MYNQKNFPLMPPTVPVAEADGLIKLIDLAHDLLVMCPIWQEPKPGDICQLIVNHSPVGVAFPLPGTIPEDPIKLKLPLEALQAEGTYRIGYRLTGYPGGVAIDSPTVLIRIDRTAPGAALLAPMMFRQINFGDALAGHVPGYAHMAAGDTLMTLCNGVQGPIYQVGNEDLAERAMQISFSRDFLQSLQSPTITMTYQVTDRAGNQSRLASPVTLSMQQ
ncbi:hypothetical protein NJC40_20200 [Pseudomonas sp. 21LCFQ02]|uniref:hypothetical protein n=1 Tax=Pseudomonas sp. 21LCFQ02 TaxID=2957505 RepID=UPI00209B6A8D|nr:hypothetical protein [Pseudomonas sp. 21LCFQ02]MCO8170087.1 hypothetical protein [Pseudomonas sp. 21LCFQ02]